MSRRSATRRAFTLVEVLVVIAIMSLLVTLAVGVSKSVMTDVRTKHTILQLETVHNALMQYRDRYDAWPPSGSSGDLLDKLDKLPGMNLTAVLSENDFYSGGSIVDAWGQTVDYYTGGGSGFVQDHYLRKNKVPLLVSPGADGTTGTADDVIVPH